MEIRLIVVGKTRAANIAEAIEEYVSRIGHYVPFGMDVVPDVRTKGGEAAQKAAEGVQILKNIGVSDSLVLLDERGREYTSVEYAAFLQKKMASGLRRLVFAVGGPYGFSEEVYGRADGMLSLSKMTFPHELVRLFFVEQTYRVMTILRGEPYHHR